MVMVRYGAQPLDLEHGVLAVDLLPRMPGAAPDADGEDWSGVVGCCHALRPNGEPERAPLPLDEGDWGGAGAA